MRELRLTPLARRLALAHGLGTPELAATGLHGRIRQADLNHLLTAGTANARPTSSIAATAPVAWMLIELDLTALVAAGRDRDRDAAPIALLAHLLATIAQTLGQHLGLNAAWAGNAIRLHPTIDLVIEQPAANPPRHHYLAQADRLTLAQWQAILHGPASDRHPAASITIRLWPAGGRPLDQPVLPDGQAVCLSLAEPRPAWTVVEERLARRLISPLAVLFDHRLLDGAPIGRFLQALRRRLAEPTSLA
jgi:pyruvate dehydrogenase E2 component (dihydrolipoamide acetyltransferase)